MTTAQLTVPVTVLTGFLGAGKTTLLNRILTENHGKRIAVIENEFGEIGVDNALVIETEEEIFEMNNGCICCTFRGDLVRVLSNLMKRRDTFDHIMIETTGLADPGPVAQTFFMEEELKKVYRLDGIVTLVDAKHMQLHLDDGDEVKTQIAFADVILLNKVDLVLPEELVQLEECVHSINPNVTIHRTQEAAIEIDKVLDLGGFDLGRALEVDQFFTSQYRSAIKHSQQVMSIGINLPGDIDHAKFQEWIRELVSTQGQNIFRMKGVVSFSGVEKRYVFHGVHMMFDGGLDRSWHEGERQNALIFIGRHLDREELNAGFEACLI